MIVFVFHWEGGRYDLDFARPVSWLNIVRNYLAKPYGLGSGAFGQIAEAADIIIHILYAFH
jgi:hypothetical protein